MTMANNEEGAKEFVIPGQLNDIGEFVGINAVLLGVRCRPGVRGPALPYFLRPFVACRGNNL